MKNIDRNLEDIEHNYSLLVIDLPCSEIKEDDSIQLKAYRAYISPINPGGSIGGIFQIENIPADVVWWSQLPDNVTVDQDGVVSGVKPGGSFIHAEIPNEYATSGSDGRVMGICNVLVQFSN